MRTAFIVLALLATPALAQEPSEEVKKAALMRAYHLNGDSMVGSRMIDMSGVDVTDPNIECFMIEGEVTKQTSFDCRQKIEAPKPKAEALRPKLAAAAEVEVPAPKPDICRRHGLRKVTEGKSWRCRK
jgi:hypothetical protein